MELTEEKLKKIVRENIIDFIRWGGFDTGEPAEDLADEFMDEEY